MIIRKEKGRKRTKECSLLLAIAVVLDLKVQDGFGWVYYYTKIYCVAEDERHTSKIYRAMYDRFFFFFMSMLHSSKTK